MHRCSNCRRIGLQVLLGNESAVALHFLGDQAGGVALVKTLHALVGNALQGLGQVQLAKALARLVGAAILLIEGCPCGWPTLQPVTRLFQAFG
jgi:hypothetical protein